MRISDWSSDVCSSDLRRWRMRLHGLAEDAIQFRSRERARRRLVGELHVFHQLTEPGPVFGGDEVQRRVIEERQLQRDLITHTQAFTSVEAITFYAVDNPRQGPLADTTNQTGSLPPHIDLP